MMDVVCEIVERETIIVELRRSSEFDLLLLLVGRTNQQHDRRAEEKRNEPLLAIQQHSPSFDFLSNPSPPPAPRFEYGPVT